MDTTLLASIAQEVTDTSKRPIQWFHLPVPIDRADDAYYRPLAELRLRPETELYLGLVHLEDGGDGGRRRMAAAQRSVQDFGVAAECGFPTPDADTIVRWPKLHAELAGATPPGLA